MLPVAVAPSFSDDNACTVRYVLPVLWMTSCFHIVGQIQIHTYSLRRSELFTVTRQVAPINCGRRGEVCYPHIASFAVALAGAGVIRRHLECSNSVHSCDCPVLTFKVDFR